MKSILKALFLLVALTTALPAFSQTEYEAAKARAEAGDDYAQTWLGDMYANGTGVVQNYQEAVKWYRLAAGQGKVDAQYNLGVMYANGEGVVQNSSRAYVWFSVAAAQGMTRAAAERDNVRAELTPQTLEQSQVQATRCFDSEFKDCD
jgi:TPR repeat protein